MTGSPKAHDIKDIGDVRDILIAHEAKREIEDKWLASWKKETEVGLKEVKTSIDKLQHKVVAICAFSSGAAGGIGALVGALGGNLATDNLLAAMPFDMWRLIAFHFGA